MLSRRACSEPFFRFRERRGGGAGEITMLSGRACFPSGEITPRFLVERASPSPFFSFFCLFLRFDQRRLTSVS